MISLRALIIAMVLPGWSAPPAGAAERDTTHDDAYQASFGNNEAIKIVEEDVAQSNCRADRRWAQAGVAAS